jgi:TolB-like protein
MAGSILIVIAFGIGTLLNAQQMTLAVIGLDARGISEYEAATLTDRLRNEFVNLGEYRVVERGMMETIMQEYALYETGCTSDECLIDVGEMLGATHIVGGSVSRFGSLFTVSTRLVDVETGELIRVYDYDFTGKLERLLTVGMRNVALSLSGLPVAPSTSASELDAALPLTKAEASPIGLSGEPANPYLDARGGAVFYGGNKIEVDEAFRVLESVQDAEVVRLTQLAQKRLQRVKKIQRVGWAFFIGSGPVIIVALATVDENLALGGLGMEVVALGFMIVAVVPGTRADIAFKRAIKRYNQVVSEEQ